MYPGDAPAEPNILPVQFRNGDLVVNRPQQPGRPTGFRRAEVSRIWLELPHHGAIGAIAKILEQLRIDGIRQHKNRTTG